MSVVYWYYWSGFDTDGSPPLASNEKKVANSSCLLIAIEYPAGNRLGSDLSSREIADVGDQSTVEATALAESEENPVIDLR